MTTPRTELGLKAEEAVCRHLASQGYRILDRNWRRPWGELDIVAALDGVIHVVEVKASSRPTQGFEPALRADRTKMHKVLRTARTWLAQHGVDSATEWQLDVASVIMESDGHHIELFRYT